MIQDMLGLVGRGALRDLTGAVLSGDLKKIIERVGEIYEAGYDLKFFFRDLVDYFRGLLLTKMDAEPDALLHYTQEEIGEMTEAARSVSLDFLQDSLHFLIFSEGELRRSGQPRLALELVLLRLARLREMIPIDALLEKLEQISTANAPGRRKSSSCRAEIAKPLGVERGRDGLQPSPGDGGTGIAGYGRTPEGRGRLP